MEKKDDCTIDPLRIMESLIGEVFSKNLRMIPWRRRKRGVRDPDSKMIRSSVDEEEEEDAKRREECPAI